MEKFFLKNRIRIESARVRGSNKDGRDVLTDSWRELQINCNMITVGHTKVK